jgi:hypothetical protein
MTIRRRNPNVQGDVGLADAISFFTREGYSVCVPLTDSQKFDLVVVKDVPQLVQVKTATCKNQRGNFVVDLRVRGGNRTQEDKCAFREEGDYDLLYVLTEDNRRYLVPVGKMEARSNFALSPAYDKFIVRA